MTKPTFSAKPAVQPTHGLCPVCGYLAPLDHLGRVSAHLQIRIRAAFDGPEEYTTSVRCDGESLQPETLNEEN